IGLPIMSQPPLPADGVYVLELSSYQIDLAASLDCDAAALTNITPDHLDRYDGFAGYAASKARLFDMQDRTHLAVFGCAGPATCASYERQRAVRGGNRTLCAPIAEWAPRQNAGPSLQGPHNLQNAAIAAAIALELGLSRDQVLTGLASFAGLPHRM